MIKLNASLPKKEYDVQVGLMRVRVKGMHRDDAIHNARLQLCREMPRMWDVIHELADARFEVICREDEN